MKKISSKDGTTLAFDQLGQGPAVILVGGGSTDRMANAPLAGMLAPHFTVYNYDRRGRSDSGDTPPYAVEREIEDLDAMLQVAGGSANVFGTSSGAALVLEAAASGLPIPRVALWEPPYIVDDSRPRPPVDQVAQYNQMVAAGRRGDAVEYFMTKVVGLPAEFAAEARAAPWWSAQEALAHTLAYDATIMGDYSLPAERAASIKAPTLVASGGASPGWMQTTMRVLVDILPSGVHRVLDGQDHNVAPEALAPLLVEFFSGRLTKS
jgi:pimeloyl-ACP methyl ester carboxylesterase